MEVLQGEAQNRAFFFGKIPRKLQLLDQAEKTDMLWSIWLHNAPEITAAMLFSDYSGLRCSSEDKNFGHS